MTLGLRGLSSVARLSFLHGKRRYSYPIRAAGEYIMQAKGMVTGEDYAQGRIGA